MPSLPRTLSGPAIQPTRIAPISQTSIASLLYLLTIFVFFEQGLVSPLAFLAGAGLMAGFLVLFFVLFRFRINTRFREPSLTSAQITASVITMLTVSYLDRNAQIVLGPFMLVAFSYGTFRLGSATLAGLAVGSMSAYLAMILTRNFPAGYSDTLRMDLLQWVIVALTLPLMVSVGTQVRKLRAALKTTRRQLQQFEEKAIRDELTGLYNRRHLHTELVAAIARADQQGIPFCLCLIDVDHFKDINDQHGHLVGDVILREFAQVARDSIRDSDVIGRYGGDEFMQILPDTDLKGAVMHAERLRVYAHFLDLQGVLPPHAISLSIGVAQYRPAETVTALIERADTALYRAKERGRNRVEWIDDI
jgi:diguanylate cyclase (GGDEF)-like protein